MNDGISPTPNPELQDQGNLAGNDGQRATVSVPAGWALVPVELTKEMQDAAANTPGMKALSDMAVTHQLRGNQFPTEATFDGSPLEQAYRAMLAAAPSGPQGQAQELDAPGVTLSSAETVFLAVRLRRLFEHFNYPLPRFADDDVRLIGIAGSAIGAVLTAARQEAPPPVAQADLTAQVVRTPDGGVAGVSVGGRAREYSGEILGAGDRKLGEGRSLEACTQAQAAKLEAFARSMLVATNAERYQFVREWWFGFKDANLRRALSPDELDSAIDAALRASSAPTTKG